MGVIPLLPRDGDDAYSFLDDHTMNMNMNMNMNSSNSTTSLNSAVDPKAISGLDSPTYYIVKWVVITSLCGTVFLWFTLGYIHARHRVRQGKKPYKYHRFLLPAHLRTLPGTSTQTLLNQRTPRPRNRRALHRPTYGRDTWGNDPPPEYSRDRPPSYQPPPSYAAAPSSSPGATMAMIKTATATEARIEERDSEDEELEIEVVESGSSSMYGTEMATITPAPVPAVPPAAVLGAERRQGGS